ncbi:MAG: phosphoenolpyruvate--protein phosphotransferase [Myxococcota bacterium]
MPRVNQNLGMVLRGVGVSPGIVLANAVRIDRARSQIERVHLPEGLLEGEIRRLQEAVHTAEEEIDRLHESLVDSDEVGEHLGVLSAHKMMLRDQMLLGETERRIRDHCLNAEWALEETLHHMAKIFARMEDPFFRERATDVQHVGDLLLRALRGEEGYDKSMEKVPGGTVIVASTLSPAEALTLARRPVAAFALDEGTATSHTAIIAHSLGIPAVVGLANVTEHVGDGERIIVDGGEGEVIVHPSPDEELVYSRRARRARAFAKALKANKELPATTPDGVHVALRANLDVVDECDRINEFGGEGVGLFRTEFLFIDRPILPAEEEQIDVYTRVLKSMGTQPVTIRTLDIGGDKLLRIERPGFRGSSGLRAIRYCLRDRDLFKTQLRALLRASVHGNLRLLIPFISSMHEVHQTKRILEEVRAELIGEGHEVAEEIPLGFMIELPAAALISDVIAQEADFISVGTNDLIQYTLAISRDDPSLEYLYHPLHPAMVRLLQMIARAGRAARIDVAMCGKMAGDPRYSLVLVALGFNELSMNAASIPLVKEVIRRTPRSQAVSLLQKIIGMSSVAEISDYVDSYMVEYFSDIVTPRMREAPRYAR